MSSIEEWLARDIAAVTGGVVVTESDLREARDAVEDRVEESKRRRRWVAVGAAAAAAVIPIAGFAVFQALDEDTKTAPAEPGPDDPSAPGDDFLAGSDPTADDVEGVWRLDNSTLLLMFNRDGTMQYDAAGGLYSDPGGTGTYEVEGDLITVTVGGPAECVGTGFQMQASVPAPGEMRIVHGEREVAACSPAAPGQRWVLEQVIPSNNQELSELSAPGAQQLEPPAGEEVLRGDWMAAGNDPMVQADGSGFVLELAADGTYTFGGAGDIDVDQGVAVVDRGTWSLSGGRLRFVSDGGPRTPDTGASAACAPGSQYEMESVGYTDAEGLFVLSGTWADGSCASEWAPSTWFLLAAGR